MESLVSLQFNHLKELNSSQEIRLNKLEIAR